MQWGSDLTGGFFWKERSKLYLCVAWFLSYPGSVCLEVCLFYCLFLLKNIYLFIWLSLGCSMQDLVPWPGIEAGPPALGVQSFNHQTTRQVSPWRFGQGPCQGWHLLGTCQEESREVSRLGRVLSCSALRRVRPRRALSHHLVARSLTLSAVLFGLAVAPLDWCPLLMETGWGRGVCPGCPSLKGRGSFYVGPEVKSPRSKLCRAWGWPGVGKEVGEQ